MRRRMREESDSRPMDQGTPEIHPIVQEMPAHASAVKCPFCGQAMEIRSQGNWLKRWHCGLCRADVVRQTGDWE